WGGIAGHPRAFEHPRSRLILRAALAFVRSQRRWAQFSKSISLPDAIAIRVAVAVWVFQLIAARFLARMCMTRTNRHFASAARDIEHVCRLAQSRNASAHLPHELLAIGDTGAQMRRPGC